MADNRVIISQINNRMKNFTKAEKKVAEYIVDRPNAVIENTIVELAEQSKCSEASIIRFCKSLGYKGYQDFKIAMARNIVDPYKHLSTVFEKDDPLETIITKTFSNLVATLEQTRNIIRADEMKKAVDVILGCNRLAIFGSGGSAIVAADVQHKFLKIGVRAEHFVDADMQLMSASLLAAGDVALGISNSGTNSGTTECLKLAGKAGAATIALTSVGKAPIMKYADIIIQNSTQETIFKSESSSGRIAQLAILDALVAAVSFREYDQAFSAIQKTRDATSGRKY